MIAVLSLGVRMMRMNLDRDEESATNEENITVFDYSVATDSWNSTAGLNLYPVPHNNIQILFSLDSTALVQCERAQD